MLLKTADNKEAQIVILKNLLAHDKVSPYKKQQIEAELRNLSIGIATEKQAAYEIDFHFGPSKNVIVLHDLRLEVNGRTAQIDHLLINRLFDVFVLETKTFSSGLSINERGEFHTEYDGRTVGLPSPIEQNVRHIAVLRDAFKTIGLPRRLGIPIPPNFRPVVLVSPKAVVKRPKSSTVDLDSIMKLDQFATWYRKTLDAPPKASDMIDMLKICAAETIEEFGRKIVQLHAPGRIDYVKKFDLADSLTSKEKNAESAAQAVEQSRQKYGTSDKTHKYFCANCGTDIAEVVAKFCFDRKARFSGRAYCRPCQTKFGQ